MSTTGKSSAIRIVTMVLGMVGFALFGSFHAFAYVSRPLLVATAPLLLFAAAVVPFALQTKILAIAGAVYAILQTLKKVAPGVISGKWAVALNIALSALAVLVTVPAQDLFSIATLTSLVLASAAAAGVHGTMRSFTQNDPVQPAAQVVPPGSQQH